MIMKNDWLQQQTSKLVDMNDLIFLQHCMKLQKKNDWFRIDDKDIAELLGVGPKRIARRKQHVDAGSLMSSIVEKW